MYLNEHTSKRKMSTNIDREIEMKSQRLHKKCILWTLITGR